MKQYVWNEEKNKELLIGRGLTFEMAVEAIKRGPTEVGLNSSSKHQGQLVFIIEIDGYPHIVPFVEDGDSIFLKTIFPDRRYKEKK